MSAVGLCQQLDLTQDKCAILEEYLDTYCKVSGVKKPRKRSRWQECIAVRRKGKKFDPQAIKELATEYRAGKCP